MIELMIVVVVIAILAAIAIPYFGDYLVRSKVIDATSKLGDVHTDMEKYFMDNRTYLNGAACGSNAKIVALNADPAAAFLLGCAATATTYTITASGVAAKGMAGFTYTINEQNIHATTAVSAAKGWSGAPKNCWITRKDGSC